MSALSLCRLRDRPADRGFLNHDVCLRAGWVSPGQQAAPLSAVLYPLRPGSLSFSDIYVVDAVSGEIFVSSSTFTLLII